MKRILFFFFLLCSLTLSAQNMYKDLMIQEINNGNFNTAFSYLDIIDLEFQGDESELKLDIYQYNSFYQYAFLNNITEKQKISLHKYFADYMCFVANYLYEQGINDDAQILYKSSLTYYSVIQEIYPLENAVINLYLGNVLYRKNDISESAKYYGNTLNLMDTYNLGDSLNYYQITINNIVSFNNDTIILKTLEEAYKIAQLSKIKTSAHQDMLYVISTMNYKIREYQKSYEYCSELLKISTEKSDYKQVALDGLLLNSIRLSDYNNAQQSIKRGANVNSSWCNESPLDLAILCDNSKFSSFKINDITKNPFTELLLKSGAEVDKYYPNLHAAVLFEDYRLCDILLRYGANPKKLIPDSTKNVIQYAEENGLKRFVSLLKNKRNYSSKLTVQELDILYQKASKSEEYENAEKLALQALAQFDEEIDETKYKGFRNKEQILFYLVRSIVNQALIYEKSGEIQKAEDCIRRAISYEEERKKYPNKMNLSFGDLDEILIRILSQRDENTKSSNVRALNDLEFYKSRGIKDRYYWMSVAQTANYFAEKGMLQDADIAYKLLFDYCSSIENPIDSIGLLNYQKMLICLPSSLENYEDSIALRKEYTRSYVFFKEECESNEICYYNLLFNLNPSFIGKEDYGNILRNYARIINESNDSTLKKQLPDLETRILYNKYGYSYMTDTTLIKDFLLNAEPFIENIQRYSSQYHLISNWIYYNYELAQWDKILIVIPTYLNNIRSEIETDFSNMSSEMANYYSNKRNLFTYDDIINMAINNSNPSQEVLMAVYDYSLFKKGLLLRNYDVLTSYIMESRDSSAIYIYDKIQELKGLREKIKGNSLNDTLITQLSWEIDNKERILYSLSYEYKNSKECEDITWKVIKDKLKSNEVAIEFVNFGYLDRYFALLIRKDFNVPLLVKLPGFINCPQEYKNHQIGLYSKWNKFHLLTSLKPLEPPHFLEFDGDPEEVYEYKANGTELYNLLWEPILEHIQPGETIYFSPSGILHQLAIEYLPIDSTRTISDVYNMVRLSSTREIVTNKSKESYKTAVVYGGISYDLENDTILAESNRYPELRHRSLENDSINRGTVDSLQGTRVEAEKINNLLVENQIEAVIYKTKSANEESFKSLNGKHNNILHIATHGFTWTDSTARKQDYFAERIQMMGDNQMRGPVIDPLDRCGLLFAGANTALQGKSKELPQGVQDGILTAKEISLMDLRDAELVVLSACETAKGDITSEGVFGLQRAFKMAGAKTIIMSLWKVDDNATQLLMTEFYTNWITKKQQKREAFRNAQNAVRYYKNKDGDYIYLNKPYYWAGFIMLD